MSGIFPFFGKTVTRIDHSRDVNNHNVTYLVAFVYLVLTKVEMFDAFDGAGSRPIYCCLAIIIDCCAGVVRNYS